MGFDGGDHTHYYAHASSQTRSIPQLVSTSNYGINGRWVYFGHEDEIVPIEEGEMLSA